MTINDDVRRCPVCWSAVAPTPITDRVYHHLVMGRCCEMSGHPFKLCYPLTVDPKLRGAA